MSFNRDRNYSLIKGVVNDNDILSYNHQNVNQTYVSLKPNHKFKKMNNYRCNVYCCSLYRSTGCPVLIREVFGNNNSVYYFMNQKNHDHRRRQLPAGPPRRNRPQPPPPVRSNQTGQVLDDCDDGGDDMNDYEEYDQGPLQFPQRNSTSNQNRLDSDSMSDHPEEDEMKPSAKVVGYSGQSFENAGNPNHPAFGQNPQFVGQPPPRIAPSGQYNQKMQPMKQNFNDGGYSPINSGVKSQINMVVDSSGPLQGDEDVSIFFNLSSQDYNNSLLVDTKGVVQRTTFGGKNADSDSRVLLADNYFRIRKIMKKHPDLQYNDNFRNSKFVLMCVTPEYHQARPVKVEVFFNNGLSVYRNGGYTYLDGNKESNQNQSFQRGIRGFDDQDNINTFTMFGRTMDKFHRSFPENSGNFSNYQDSNSGDGDMFGRNLLFYGVAQGRLDVVKGLIEEQKYDPEVKDVCGYQPLDIARIFNQDVIWEYLHDQIFGEGEIDLSCILTDVEKSKSESTEEEKRKGKEEETEGEDTKTTKGEEKVKLEVMRIRCGKCQNKVIIDIEQNVIKHNCEGRSGTITWDNGVYSLDDIIFRHKVPGQGKAHEIQKAVVLGTASTCKKCGKKPISRVGVLAKKTKRDEGGTKFDEYSVTVSDIQRGRRRRKKE